MPAKIQLLKPDFWSWVGIINKNIPIGGLPIYRVNTISLSVTDDQSFVYVRIEFDKEVQLQDDNSFQLNISNSGIDMSFKLGDRQGTIDGISINHYDINLVASPTVTSRNFELQISKHWEYGTFDHDLSGDIEVSLSNDRSGGDEVPNSGSLTFDLTADGLAQPQPSFSLARVPDSDFRICTYNVLNDNLFNSSASTSFINILQTIDADIYAFQEVRDFGAEETLTRLFNVLGVLDTDQTWFARKRGPDNVIISRYPIVFSRDVAGNGLFIVDKDGQDILVANVHFPCCDNDDDREDEIDELLSFIRDARNGLNNLRLDPGTPIVVTGDTNFVGFADQVSAILDGDIFNNSASGADFSPDWDDTGLADAVAYSTGTNTLTTWRNKSGSFFPGRLDYCFYTDSELELLNTYSLDTENLSAEELQNSLLEIGDTDNASDHFPVVTDFKIRNSTATAETTSFVIKAWPNPTTDYINLELEKSNEKTRIYDVKGQLIYSGIETRIDVSEWETGVYSIEIVTSSGKRISEKIKVIRN